MHVPCGLMCRHWHRCWLGHHHTHEPRPEVQALVRRTHLLASRILSRQHVLLCCQVSCRRCSADGERFLPRRELQGVKVRIEIGPKEAQESSCILSVCTKPGEVAAKTPLKVSPALLFSKTATAEPLGLAERAEAALRGCCPVTAAAGVIRLAYALKRDV